MVDHDVRLEALSALLGKQVKSQDEFPGKTTRPSMTVDDFFIAALLGNPTLLKQVASVLGNDVSKGSVALETESEHSESDEDERESSEGVAASFRRVLSKLSALQDEFFIDESEFFDPLYDFDFTDDSTSDACTRGNEPYERPCGWYRMALKVKDKYPDGNTWLGTDGWRSESVPGEWPVSYHGTNIKGAKGIIRSHYKAGGGDVYGRGIYSTPKLSIAPLYTKTFQSKKNGNTYRVVMQNRINPKERKICEGQEDYWLIPVPERTSAEKERHIVERSIRPYGILIQEIKKEMDESDQSNNDSDERKAFCSVS